MTDHPVLPIKPSTHRRRRACPATAATINLATAAQVLGIGQDVAVGLAERDEFPCTVIRTRDGYRVPFAALLRILRSGRARRTDPAHDQRPAGTDREG